MLAWLLRKLYVMSPYLLQQIEIALERMVKKISLLWISEHDWLAMGYQRFEPTFTRSYLWIKFKLCIYSNADTISAVYHLVHCKSNEDSLCR
jgi:hypothetical protein